MTASGETLYTFRTPYPDVLQRGRANKVKLQAFRDGAEITTAITAWTFSLVDAAGTVLDSATSSGAMLRTTAVLADTLEIGEGYQQVWRPTMPDGITYTIDRECAVGLRPIYPVITDADLLAVYPDLAALKGSLTSLQGFIDEAWKRIVYRWITEGRLTYQLKSAWVLRAPHLELVFELFFAYQGKAQPNRGNFLELADRHGKAYERTWRQMSVTLDLDNDGRVDDTASRKGSALLHPNAAPHARLRCDPRW